MSLVVSAIVVLTMFVGLPVWLLISLQRKSLSEIMYGPSGRRKSRAAIGNALGELDRLMARPSVEYRIQAEDSDKLVEDETGGE